MIGLLALVQRTLLCAECGKTCDCLIYGRWVRHVHLAGGDERYELCNEHSQAFLARHRTCRVLAAGGTEWAWLKRCEAGCQFDKLADLPYRPRLKAWRGCVTCGLVRAGVFDRCGAHGESAKKRGLTAGPPTLYNSKL